MYYVVKEEEALSGDNDGGWPSVARRKLIQPHDGNINNLLFSILIRELPLNRYVVPYRRLELK